MRKFLMLLWTACVPAGFTFGPLFMTGFPNMSNDHRLQLAGVAMVALSGFWMLRTIRVQGAEIERLKEAASPTNP